MKEPFRNSINLEVLLKPESVLEKALLQEEAFVKGLYWGVPRYGHPEGEVYKHVVEILHNIEQLDLAKEDRMRLRVIAFAHDAFKYVEDKNRPRDWKKHHATLARNFLEKHTDDHIILTITEWHDEAYYVWRDLFLNQQIEKGQQRLDQLLLRLGDFRQLYYLFFKCDTQTGDKNPTPMEWVEANLPGIKPVTLKKAIKRYPEI